MYIYSNNEMCNDLVIVVQMNFNPFDPTYLEWYASIFKLIGEIQLYHTLWSVGMKALRVH